jgi:16S rRNA (cytidine1402-2'-O)-methyltransferase
MATLYIVGTPIGNLEDITLRALKVLSSVDFILCEDTRMTKRLLDRHGISTKTISYHMHSKLARVEEIIGLLKEGKNMALVSDAGTPGISDPGAELVARIRGAFNVGRGEGHSPGALHESVKKVDTFDRVVKIESVPGPSALTAALSIAGVPCADFTFLGFLPHKKGRETLFKEIAAAERTMVFYESPHRIMKTLDSLAMHLAGADEKVNPPAGGKNKNGRSKCVTVCRELTKIFEEVVSGTPEEVRAYFESHPDKVRGEFVVIVSE